MRQNGPSEDEYPSRSAVPGKSYRITSNCLVIINEKSDKRKLHLARYSGGLCRKNVRSEMCCSVIGDSAEQFVIF